MVAAQASASAMELPGMPSGARCGQMEKSTMPSVSSLPVGDLHPTKSSPMRGVITMLPALSPTHTVSVRDGKRSTSPDSRIQWYRYRASPPATSRTSVSRTSGTHFSSSMLGSAVSSSTPTDLQPRPTIGFLGSFPLTNCQALSPGPTLGCPYMAVGMLSALHVSMRLPSRLTRALRMLVFETPPDVNKSCTRRTLPHDRPPVEWLHGPMTSVDAPLADLVAAMPDGVVVTEADGMEKYRFDWSRDQSAGTPAAVVRAESAEQVQTAVRWASEHGVSVVPRGAGSGLSGGSTAVDGCLVLSLERMNTVEIDPDCQVAIAQPGAFNADVKRAAGEHGLWYPPDPSSFEICSIGGNVATNAGGLCCVKYGVTTDYVLGMEV